jgi:hypothetical protein
MDCMYALMHRRDGNSCNLSRTDTLRVQRLGTRLRSLCRLALIFSVLNALDKIVRVSFKDPWLHPSNDDRYPLLYMRRCVAELTCERSWSL